MTFTPRSSRLPALALAGLIAVGALAGCSGGGDSQPSGSPTTTASPSGNSPTPTESGSPSPTRIVAVLCDEATEETQAAIRAAMKPEFTVTQLIDVRADDDAQHAVLGYVQGPGKAILAQWVGTGLAMEGLVAVDENTAEVSNTTVQTEFDTEVQDLLDNTVKCYTAVFGPDEEE